jgi:hypothetical protein
MCNPLIIRILTGEPATSRKTKKQSIVAIDDPVRHVVHRSNPLLKEIHKTEMRAKTNAVRTLVISKDPKTESSNPVNHPRMEIQDPRPVGYIPSRLPQKIISKLVVGAEALPE